MLREVATRLAATVRPGDLVARLGGDEFAVLLEGVERDEALEITRRLRDAIEQAVVVDGVTLHVQVSVRVALHPFHGTDGDTLMHRADVAMYACKGDASSLQLWAPDVADDENRRLLREQLRVALHTDQLVLHCQPKVHLASGEVRGVEALVRWQHPERGLLGPDAFLPVAESSGLMSPLTTVVLGTALRQCRAWRDAGLELSVAVNLSPSTLVDHDLPLLVRSLLERVGLPPSALDVETTETVLLDERRRGCASLEQLRALGVRIALDDYGTGFSSLAYLSQLPVDELKLDKSLVQALGDAPRDEAIVRSTVELTHALGLTLVAEGVENAKVLDALVSFGCDTAQGYDLARPTPADALTQQHECLRRPRQRCGPVPIIRRSGTPERRMST